MYYRYHEEPRPEFVGPMKINNHLKHGRRIFENEIVGPEGFATDSEGRVCNIVIVHSCYSIMIKLGNVYTGLADGRIIRLSEDFNSYMTVARTGKPPFDKCGEFDAETIVHVVQVVNQS